MRSLLRRRAGGKPVGNSASVGFRAVQRAIRPIRLVTIDALEARTLLTVSTTFAAHTTADLVSDINSANTAGGSSTINLDAGATYDFTAVDNDWYGPNALPAIASN